MSSHDEARMVAWGTVRRLCREHDDCRMTLGDMDEIINSYLAAAGLLRDRAPRGGEDKTDEAIDAIRTALELVHDLVERHDRWCGHNPDAPGDMIVNVAQDKAVDALNALDCLAEAVSSGNPPAAPAPEQEEAS